MIDLAAAIRRRGSIPFSELVEAALYDEDEGFYATTGTAGRDGDFITSPELGPLFGAVIARALDGWWTAMGEPDPFIVVEAAAGPGTLCRAVLDAHPRCQRALRYVLVERSAAQRARHGDRLPLEHAAHAFAPRSTPVDDDLAEPVDLPLGPIVVSLADLPRVDGGCVVIANELLDNLPFDLYERRAGAWSEVRVGLTDDEGSLIEMLVPVADVPPELAGIDAPDGSRVPRQHAAAAWVRDALPLARGGGRVVCFDYARTTAELAARPWKEWVRTFRKHGKGGSPLDALGSQDITVEVAVDQLPPPASVMTQADWLRAHGIDELVAEARATWQTRAAIGDLAALRAQSRVHEANALLDPDGPGSFLVLEWTG
jgi:SAM-dependent MidA family methyltransferase